MSIIPAADTARRQRERHGDRRDGRERAITHINLIVSQTQQRLGDALRQPRPLVLDAGDVGRGAAEELDDPEHVRHGAARTS